jgi:cytochrome c oxidase subunit 1
VNAVASVFWGKRTADAPKAQKASPPVAAPVRAAVGAYGSAETLYIPGTIVLVGVFFVSFILYYYVNWKYLAEVWPLR